MGRYLLAFWMLGVAVFTVHGLPATPQNQFNTNTQPKPFKVQPPILPVLSLEDPGIDDQLWGTSGKAGDRKALLAAVEQSLRYLQSEHAIKAYQNYPIPGVDRGRVQRSLKRFRQLLLTAPSAAALQAAVEREFVFYQATGNDGQGTVAFTGYFEPVHVASRIPTREFRYPIYRLPPDFNRWGNPPPTRLQLEGEDGLQFSKGRLKGLALAWLHDRLEAYLIQVQGSARLRLTDGSTMTIGYAGHTNYPYTSIGKELVKTGKISQEDLSLPALIKYFEQNPTDLNIYLPRNQRFVFLKKPMGHLQWAVWEFRLRLNDRSPRINLSFRLGR